MADTSFLRDLPKVEIHLHLEGAIPPAALWELVLKYHGQREVGAFSDLAGKFRYRDFTHFIDTWIWVGRFLREYEDYRFVAAEIARDLVGQNVKYAEIFYSPSRDSAKHLNAGRITEAIVEGLQKCRKDMTARLVADIVRDNGPEEAMRMVEDVREVKSLGVAGIGLGGTEFLYPAEPFRAVYERARQVGFRTTVHAGETLGAESIWAAVRLLKADRIGHGIRAGEDERLLQDLLERRVPLEVCPVSNLRTGVVARMTDHPIADFYRRGLNVCVNTDDPKMFNTSLENEFSALIDTFGFGAGDIAALTGNAIEASWATEAEKAVLRKTLADSLSRVPGVPGGGRG